jgi:hypothetical protein
MLELVPSESAVLQGTPGGLSACAYGKLDEAGLKKVDLSPAESRLMMETPTRVWEVTFTAAEPGRTNVALSQARTMAGPFPAPKVMPAINSCAAR